MGPLAPFTPTLLTLSLLITLHIYLISSLLFFLLYLTRVVFNRAVKKRSRTSSLYRQKLPRKATTGSRRLTEGSQGRLDKLGKNILYNLNQHRLNSIARQEQFYPINLSSQELDADQKSLLSKGPSFCPVPRDINRTKLLEDWEKFDNRLRSAVFLHNQDDNNDSSVDDDVPSLPTIKKPTSWKAPVSCFPELELFLESVKTDLLNPDNVLSICLNRTAAIMD